MSRNVKRSPRPNVNGPRTGEEVTMANCGAPRWFRDADRERLSRLRLEERRKERLRIARELHDTLFQGFLGASLQLQDAVELLPENSPAKPSLNRALRLMRRVIDEGRDALLGLRSVRIASTSLEQALTSLRDELAPGEGVTFRVFVTGQPHELTLAVQEQIYMIGREALVNALRHSEATNIEAEVEYLPRRLRVVVRDNGCGIHPDIVRSGRSSHWGLAGMRERAAGIGAQFRVWSRPGAGTEVEISIPSEIVAGAGSDTC